MRFVVDVPFLIYKAQHARPVVACDVDPAAPRLRGDWAVLKLIFKVLIYDKTRKQEIQENMYTDRYI